MIRKGLRHTVVTGALALALTPAPAQAAAPIVEASIATRDGSLIGPVAVRARAATVKVGGRRCAVAAGTPLAALVALKAKAPQVGALGLRDYATCGRRPSSSSRLFVTKIGRDASLGADGWIYDIDTRRGATGAADPIGPFAKGRLRAGQQVSWRWCRISEDPEGDCGDALVITETTVSDVLTSAGGPQLDVTVKRQMGGGADGAGALSPGPAGLAVELRSPAAAVLASATTDANGRAALDLPAIVPPGSRVAATGPTGVAPTGRLWPALP